MKPTILAETPQPSPAHEELWSSDAIARMLQALDVPWVSLVPGASFRGLGGARLRQGERTDDGHDPALERRPAER